MKKILLVGLTDQEAAAIEIMIGMNWRDAQCTVLRRSLSLAMPEQTPEALACTHCVVDLFGLGMRKYSAENAERLMAFLGGRSAVALAWGADGGGWMGQKLPLAAGQVLELLLMPYSSHDMKTALGKVRQGKAPVNLAAAGHAAPAPFGGLSQILSQPRPVSANSALPPETAPDKEIGLLKGAIPILLNAFPDLQGNPFFRLVQQIISHEGPQVLTFGDEMFFILAPREGWIASPLPLSNIAKMAASSSMLGSAKVVPLPEQRVEEELRRHFGEGFRQAQKPLDFLCWVLADSTLRQNPPQRRADLRFRLRRFPNFTLLPNTSNFEIQLAAICSRAPQSLEKLCRSFPQHDPADIARFAILCIVSGSAVALPASAPIAAPAPVPAAAAKPAHAQAARKGFFKSLLDKLF